MSVRRCPPGSAIVFRMRGWSAVWRTFVCGITLWGALCVAVVPHAPATSGALSGDGRFADMASGSPALVAAVASTDGDGGGWHRAGVAPHGAGCVDVGAFVTARAPGMAADVSAGNTPIVGQAAAHGSPRACPAKPPGALIGLTLTSATVVRV
ncbi:hypothetical protein Sya03_57830 [Spirilliplanes yamanashiensis]|uniref:Uncharacterized protein n=1 Tax=Spirilliplanes yamanashiensis TaxID=42233 RepID=A0A8J4DLX7_9ACTN|nr:hypothetical protein Sya03_57830 [Spirilliplanes yamanashiensis]